MTYSTLLPKPRNEQDFEDLCRDLCGVLWAGAQLYGRRGQKQHGIDIDCRTAEGRVGVQCKNYHQGIETSLLDQDVEKARTLRPSMKRLIFATSAARDKVLQDHLAEIAERTDAPDFAVEIWFWDFLCRKLDDHEDLRRRWRGRLLGEEEEPLVSVDRLPSSILPKLIGRESELELLENAWRDREIKVQSVVAVGGAGKTALVHHWMQGFEHSGWKEKGAEAAFAWSFYSQGGGGDRQATGDAFIDAALRRFGEKDPPKTHRDRGLRLAELVRRRRTLLILDGLEPLQHPPSSAQAGKVKDPAVAAVIRSLAADNPGLLLLTTREPVADLQPREGRGVHTHDLEKLSSEAGAALLRWLGVKGKDGELETVSEEVHGHAFTLTILGTFLRDAHEGDVRAWKDVQLLEAAGLIHNEQAEKVMAAYVNWFGDSPERQILSLLGLFDRPADAAAVQALREDPPISGLTDRLVDLGSTGWKLVLKRLRRARLVLEEEALDGEILKEEHPALDAHPLVREHFGRVLEQEAPKPYKEGHLRLYRHYAAATDDLPETLEGLQPLYLAIGHGCRAGRRQEVFDEVYQRRVQRGREFFSVDKLGAFGADLTALAGFFERPWDAPARELQPGNRAWLLNSAGAWLRALGRLADAVEPMATGLQVRIGYKKWKHAAASASNLSELALTLGQVGEALDYGRQAVELAEQSGDLFQRMVNRANLGNALHAAGELEEAEEAFQKAEGLQVKRQAESPMLTSVGSYRYCDLLLSRAAPLDSSALGREALVAAPAEARGLCEEVQERARYARKIAERNRWLLDIALDHLSLGCATLGLTLATGGGLEIAAESLHESVRGLRAAGHEDDLPRGLLARATLYRFQGDEAAAEADLAEALEIAERGSMKLHECDAHLEWARLRFSLGDLSGARDHLDKARALVTATGYHRRDREVRELEEALNAKG